MSSKGLAETYLANPANKIALHFSPCTETFESANFADGRILYDKSSSDNIYTYHYFVTDHQGSTRLVVNDDGAPLEAINYQPYGTMESVANLLSPELAAREKFTGKEYDTEGAGHGVVQTDIALDFPLPPSSEATPNRMEVFYSDAPNDISKADVIPVLPKGSAGHGKLITTLGVMENRMIDNIKFHFADNTINCTVVAVNREIGPDKKVVINGAFSTIADFTGEKGSSFLNYTTTTATDGAYMAGIGKYYFGARYYDPDVGSWGSKDAAGQFFNAYGYGTNPVIMVDEDGNFITWSIGSNGLSLGFNLTPIGIPWGAGVNVGWGGGASLGAYTEVGYRLGGTGAGLNRGTISQSLDYNFKHGDLSTTTTESIGGSFLFLNAGASTSQRYSITNDSWSYSWGVGVGAGFSDGKGNTLGANIGYGGDFKGNNDWSWGLSGSMDRSGHYKRNELNGDLTATDLIDGQGKLKDRWIEMNDPAVKKYHTQGLDPENVFKYANVKTGQEVVVYLSPSGKPIILNQSNNARNMGTLNYYTPTNLLTALGHFGVDMLPYYFYGNASNDKTNFGQRFWRSFE